MALPSGPPDRIAPPPDYAGVAFRESDTRPNRDFPETFIPQAGHEAPSEKKADNEQVYLQSEPDNTPPESFESESLFDLPPVSESFESASDDAMDASGRSDTETIHPSSELSSPENEEGETVFLASEQEAPSSPPSSEGETSDPSALLTWLRELKMEDLLLFWLIVMLLYGETRDEINLLLGLLLFANG